MFTYKADWKAVCVGVLGALAGSAAAPLQGVWLSVRGLSSNIAQAAVQKAVGYLAGASLPISEAAVQIRLLFLSHPAWPGNSLTSSDHYRPRQKSSKTCRSLFC